MTAYNLKTDFGAVGDGVTDDAAAFVRAGDALNGTSGNDLIIPAGTYTCLSNGSVGTGRFLSFWAEGIVQARIIGAGSGSTSIKFNQFCNQLAARGQKQNGNNFGKIASVSAGSSTATLLTLSDYTKFSLNQWVLVAGLNIQDIYSPVPAGYGYPANLTVFEYVQITGINSGTGVLTFGTPLTQSYLSTWPEQNTGSAFEVNSGGPAGIYSLPLTWNVDIEYQSLSIEANSSSGQIYSNGRKVTFRDCAFPNGSGVIIPSQNKDWAAYNCTANVISEVDKLISNMTMDGCTWKTLDFQSASVTNLIINNCTMESLVGSGIDSIVTGSSFSGYVQPGPFAYGCADSFEISNCSVAEWRPGGYSGAYALVNSPERYGTMAGGLIALPNGTNVTNITDNGSGKCRFTVLSSAGYTAGKFVPIGFATQELTTTATASSGTNVLTFASVPAWITNGQAVLGASSGYSKIPDGTTVSSTTSTTITLSNNVTSNIVIGDKLAARPAALQKGVFDNPPPTILSIVDGTTIDFDINFPAGFVYSSGASLSLGSAISWAIPGKYMYWIGTSGRSRAFKVLSVTQDANKTYVQTNEPGGFPTIPVGSNLTQVSTAGAQRIRATSLTGASPDNVQLMYPQAYNKPFGSYFKTTYTGSDSPTAAFGRTVLGNLVSITIDVQTAYTGAQANLFLHLSRFDNMPFIVDGVATTLGWGIDVRTVGKRIITPANTVTNATKQTNDGPLLVPSWSSSFWINSQTSMFLKNTASLGGGSLLDISGEASNLWPVVVVEIQADQGFQIIPTAVAPLRLRLRA